MHTETQSYFHQETELEAYIAYPENRSAPCPAVLIAHDWSGRNEFAEEKARFLAGLGYVAVAIDMYGKGKLGQSNEEKMALMGPLVEDRALLQARIKSALEFACTLDQVDATQIAAMGFCFGGLCVLDLARSGADIQAVVSFHGLLGAPNHPNQTIKARILALHGHDDPMATPEQALAFQTEMTAAKADWQMHIYGGTQHAFTNPNANDTELGTIYNARAESRSLLAMQNFFEEVFTD